MTAEILWLDRIGTEDLPLVGGKAAVLARLLQEGLPVPFGFCISAEAGREAGREAEIGGEAGLWVKVSRAYQRLAPDKGPVAVRSSAVDEDSPQVSFAGQYETILNVEGEIALREAVRRCWQSAQADRVQAYRARHQSPPGRLAVLVQRQVQAQVGGVLFTQNPMSGDEGQILVEASPGQGDQLVSGLVSPGQYVLDRQGGVLSAPKQELLTPEQCAGLADLVRRIEQNLGSGLDIEWAIAQGHIYILQARPITGRQTTLPLSEVWTRANVGEVLPNVVTPLTWSVFRAALLVGSSAREDFAQVLQVNGENGHDDRRSGKSEIRRSRGRVYIRLDALLDSFCYLPGVTPSIIGQALGVSLPPPAQTYTSPSGLPVRLAQAVFGLDALGLFPRLEWLAQRLPRLPEGLSAGLDALLNWTASCFRLHLKATAYAIGAFALLERWLASSLPEEERELLPIILPGLGNPQSAVQGLALWHLAEEARANPGLLKILDSSLCWTDVIREAAQVSGGLQFLGELKDFLNKNGARAAGEFELAVPRWRDDPAFVLGILRKHLHAQSSPLRDEAEQRRLRQEAVAHVRASLGRLQGWVFEQVLYSFWRYITLRENIKYRLMEGYAGLRQLFLRKGQTLVDAGLLDQVEDVFFLTLAEIQELEGRDANRQSKRQKVLERMDQHARWQGQPAPDLIVGDGSELVHQKDGELAGIGSSPGIAIGPARVLLEPSQAGDLQPGEILVAPHTDPGWTPLFLSCSAVVTEIGGFLSHGATVAREYGIPCVVNVAGVTTQIHTGDWIRVDGTNGRVSLWVQDP